MNRNADSYVTTASGLKNTGYYVVLRSEYDFVASKRLQPGLLARAEAIANGQEVPELPPRQAPVQQETVLSGNESELLTFDEALAALKVRRTKMYALLRSGALSAVKIGKLWRIERSAIKEYLESIKSGN
ncbi:MAG: helix-turn-helix domain-containing protein [Lentisphaeria bacterium]|nr:helix-turn-helix domain-containing protein [Lentisphaeria bacterium]